MDARRYDIRLLPNRARVMARPLGTGDVAKVKDVIGRVLSLDPDAIREELDGVYAQFAHRHDCLDRILEQHFAAVRPHLFSDAELPRETRLLLGAFFTMEYSLEGAALFNPSIVPHPDQSGLASGSLRFILSLRAVGEGHISSIVFRTGTITAEHDIVLDPNGGLAGIPTWNPSTLYAKATFQLKLRDLGYDPAIIEEIVGGLSDEFSRDDLNATVHEARHRSLVHKGELHRTIQGIEWLADSNYEITFDEDIRLSDRVIFPGSSTESHGIEDARFVLFTDGNGEQRYYATYTAYSGTNVLPQLMSTRDFLTYRMITLNGESVVNKGMALFPRLINGRYAMISRLDGQNLFIMYSDHPHFWNEAKLLLKPLYRWQFFQMGNCGSPIETEAGWILLTHGVGPMRRYSIGAVLLDRDDPSHVIGRLKTPLIEPEESEREGYVPNVVYTCGALIHNGMFIVPYAMSDYATGFRAFYLDALLEALTEH